MQQTLRRWLQRGATGFALCVVLLWTTFPIAFAVRGSFKPVANVMEYPPRLLGPVTLENYRDFWVTNPDYGKNLLNSILSTAGGVVLTLLIALAAAYAFSRFRGRWLRIPALLIILVRMFPPIVVTIPLYPVLNSLGLIDTLTTLIVTGAAFSVSIATLLLKAFIDDIPVELEQAAMIDGCTRFGAFWRITLPLVAPGIAAVMLFVAIALWNEYLLPLVFTSSDARTAPVAIAITLSHTDGVAWGSLLAMSTLQLAPMLLLVLVLHKHLVRGMTMGAVKG